MRVVKEFLFTIVFMSIMMLVVHYTEISFESMTYSVLGYILAREVLKG